MGDSEWGGCALDSCPADSDTLHSRAPLSTPIPVPHSPLMVPVPLRPQASLPPLALVSPGLPHPMALSLTPALTSHPSPSHSGVTKSSQGHPRNLNLLVGLLAACGGLVAALAVTVHCVRAGQRARRATRRADAKSSKKDVSRTLRRVTRVSVAPMPVLPQAPAASDSESGDRSHCGSGTDSRGSRPRAVSGHPGGSFIKPANLNELGHTGWVL